MPGIYIMGLLVGAAALWTLGMVLFVKSRRADWPVYALAIVLTLPLAAATLYLVRLPLDNVIKGLGPGREAYLAISSFYAPVTEELAKLLPLLLPFLYRRTNRDNAVRVGLALGLGFGLGEVGLLAWTIAKAPAVAALPWYAFSGFFLERLMVCFLHGGFVAVTLWLWFRGKRWGIGVAMALHYLLNFPIFLAVLGVFGANRDLFYSVAFFWVVLMTVAMALLVVFFLAGRRSVKQILSRDHVCPGCGAGYVAPMLGLNMMHKRYERCPHCRKWHWVFPLKKPDDPG